MRGALLTRAASASFLTHLRAECDRSGLGKIAEALGCCRKTAWNLTRPGCKTLVRRAYAIGLAKFLGVTGREPWDTSTSTSSGVKDIVAAWVAADDPTARRRVAQRLSIYLTEKASLDYKLVVSSQLVTSTSTSPSMLRVTLSRPFTSDYYSITFMLAADVKKTPWMTLRNHLGEGIFNGPFTAGDLIKIFNRILE